MPPTGLTLGKAKQWLDDHTLAYTIKKTSALILGEYEYTVQCKEEVDDNRSEKRNYRLYVNGSGNEAYARWEKNQCPAFFNQPTTTPEPAFVSRVEAYIKKKMDDNTIKFGFIAQPSELTKKAICNVIMPDKTDKTILVTESAEGAFSFELL